MIDALGGKGPFTVFAPSNAAFEKAKDLIPADVANLKKLLLRHVVKGEKIMEFSKPGIEGFRYFDTMNDRDRVATWVMWGKDKMVGLAGLWGSKAKVDDIIDIEVSNGIIYIISDVLILVNEFPTLDHMSSQLTQGEYILR